MSDDMERRLATLERQVATLTRQRSTHFALSRSLAPALDGGPVQTIQGQIDPLSKRDAMPVLFQYGFSSSLPMNGDKVVAFIDGDRSKAVVIATGHQAYRYKGLIPGESVMHDMWGNSIHMTGAGILVSSSSVVTVNAPVLATTGDVAVGTGATGTLTDSTGSVATVQDGIIVNIS
jgi:phage gp45-like